MQQVHAAAAGGLTAAAAQRSGSGANGSGDGGGAFWGLWVPALTTRQLSHIPTDVLLDGGPHCWGFLALLGWVLWLATQAPWRALRGAPEAARRLDGAPAAAAAAWAGGPPRRRGALGGGHGPLLPTVLRTCCYGCASALLWISYLETHQEFRSWEDVYFFCGAEYQHCTAGFRWDGSGWVQAFVLWNFVLSSALLLQKFVIALGLGGLLPGEEVVTRESFVSIAWRLVPYWMNQWEQQWGAECSSMLFELPHFALELLVVLPCVQIICGRLRVMSQPHVREPPAAALLPLPAGPGPQQAVAPRAAEEEQPGGGAAAGLRPAAGAPPPPQQQPRVAMLGGEAVGADAPAAGYRAAPDDGPAPGAAAGRAGEVAAVAGCWVPDVMRCRWRRDPQQRRLMPRLRANIRAMSMIALILAVAASNSLLVPLALESWPASSERADQILRFKKELSFLVTTGRHADTALWYQRVAAAAAAAAAQEEAGGGETPWTIEGKGSGGGGSGNGTTGGAAGHSLSGDGSNGGGEAGSAGGAGFLAAALEGSSNSSRLDAKLAVWSTLWRPLLPAHWLRAVLAADSSQVAGLDPAFLSALQYEEHPQSVALAQQLHAAANSPSAAKAAAEALQQLLRHPEQAGSILPSGADAGEGGKGGGGSNSKGVVHLLLMATMAAGIDAKAAPLQLKAATLLAAPPATEKMPPGGSHGAASSSSLAQMQQDLRWLRHQQQLYASKLVPPASSAEEGGTNASSAAPPQPSPTLTWHQQQRMAPLYRLLHKHCAELERMRSPDHHRLIPLVELSLAIMRLSCERFFSLLAVFLGFLLFRDPQPAAQRAIRVIAAFAAVFQRLVLYSFPAICWAYGAGALFSSFVSVVFWTGPLVRAVERVRNAATSVQPRQWRAATAGEVERMGGQCAICWGDMLATGGASGPSSAEVQGQQQQQPATPGRDAAAAAAPAAAPDSGGRGVSPTGSSSSGATAAMSLPCGHAYHRECLQQWLQQCYSQARAATCPMCQASIPLRVRWRMPWQAQQAQQAQQAAAEDAAGGGQQAAAEGIPGLAALALQLQEDFRARFEPMLDVAVHPDVADLAGAVAALPAAEAQQEWPPAEAVLLPPQGVALPPLPGQPAGGQPQQQPAAAEGMGAAAAPPHGGVQEEPAQQQQPQPQQRQQQQEHNQALAAPGHAGLEGAAAAQQQQQQQLGGHLGAALGAVLPAQPIEERRRGLLGRLLRRRR